MEMEQDHPVVVSDHFGVVVFHALTADHMSARGLLVRQIQADMRLRQRALRMQQSLIVTAVVVASAVALAWLYSASGGWESVSMAASLSTLHEVQWQGEPEGRVIETRLRGRCRV